MIRVRLPAFSFSAKVMVEIGPPWSPIEHLVLMSLNQAPASIDRLCLAHQLSRGVILECLHRLMMAAWVEVTTTDSTTFFSITPSGADVVEFSELPSTAIILPRRLACTIELATGGVFSGQSLKVDRRHDPSQNLRDVIYADQRVQLNDFTLHAAVSKLLPPGERLRSIDPDEYAPELGHAEVLVQDGYIRKPENRSQNLDRLLVHLYNKAKGDRVGLDTDKVEPTTWSIKSRTQPMVTNSTRFIIGKRVHLDYLQHVLRHAQSRIIIHSTFLSDSTFTSVFDLMVAAVERGVLINILWGADETEEKVLDALTEIVTKIEEAGVASGIQVHEFTTTSHAKLLMADLEDGFELVVASYNWLYGGTKRVNASVLTREPTFIRQGFEILERLSVGPEGSSSEFRFDMVELANRANLTSKTQSSKSNAFGAIVLGAEHEEYSFHAFATAKKSILVTSDNLSAIAESSIFASADSVRLPVTILYSKTSGGTARNYGSKRAREFDSEHVKLQAVGDRELHAKVLAWDDDHVLVTSLNWLSKTPNDSLSEIGFYVCYPGAAKEFRKALATELNLASL